MFILKRNLLFLMLLGLISITACSDDDDDCTAPALEENIVGSWEVSTDGVVTFNADGTFEDADDAILGFPDVEDEDKTYVVSGTTVELTSAAAGTSISTELEVTDNQCDRIEGTAFGVPITFERQ